MKNKKSIPGYIKRDTVFLIIGIAFFAGFMAGVLLTVHKTGVRGQTNESLDPEQAKFAEKIRQIKMFEKETDKNPNNIEAWTNLGHLYFDTDNYTKAINAYQKSLSLDPQNANVWTDLGVMYRRNGQAEASIKAFDKAIKINPKHEISRFNKGIVLLHDLNDTKGAILVWQELLKINPIAKAPTGQSIDELIEHYKNHPKETTP